jgi:hypothetical protein
MANHDELHVLDGTPFAWETALMMRAVFFSLTILAAACGGKAKPATTSTATEPAGNPGEQHEHHFPAEVGAFHDKLAPLWHADAGQPRVDQTCAATGELDALAASIAKAPAPEGTDAAAWSTKAAELQASITKLSAACGDPARATFDADFEGVHHAFHHLIELMPATEEHKAAS